MLFLWNFGIFAIVEIPLVTFSWTSVKGSVWLATTQWNPVGTVVIYYSNRILKWPLEEGTNHWLNEPLANCNAGGRKEGGGGIEPYDRINQLFHCLSPTLRLLFASFNFFLDFWVWSQHIVLELPRHVTSCLLVVFFFPPFVPYVVRKDALISTERYKCHIWRDFVCFL